MDPAQENITRQYEDGTYFEEARKWYSLLYIGPISERIFFLVITGIALLISIFSFISVLNLLPIAPRVPFVYRAKDMMGEIPTMIRFKAANEPSNPALVRYYLGLYVTMRESYNEADFNMRAAFNKHYSDDKTFGEYHRIVDPNNPRSPIRQYGKYAEVKVEVQSVNYDRGVKPYKGIVNFSTEVIGSDKPKKTNWTATISFEYTDLVEQDRFDEQLDDYVLTYNEPTFRVVSYDVRERLVTTP